MDKLCIQGGCQLRGEVKVSGAKNAALPVLCASLLSAQPLYLNNVPGLRDVHTMLALLQQMGVRTEVGGECVTLDGSNINNRTASYDLVKAMRASILVLGPLLSRFGQARVSMPGGCAIGMRPVDQHIEGLKALGADIHIEKGYIEARAQCLKGAHIVLDMVTVTGTENLMMAATLAQGQTIIENAACEPEVTDLAQLLVSMGAKISGMGTNRLVIQGVKHLHGAQHTVVGDRIEAGTFLCAATATGGEITLRGVSPLLLEMVLEKLTEAGARIQTGEDWIRLTMDHRPAAVSFRTSEYPAFPTDLQAQFMALNCIAQGSAQAVETIFENRFMHVPELNRLGAHIVVEGNTAFITGVEHLLGAKVMATDLRASAGLVIAALTAQGETSIDRIYHLDRGYEQMEKKLCALGAKVWRVRSSS